MPTLPKPKRTGSSRKKNEGALANGAEDDDNGDTPLAKLPRQNTDDDRLVIGMIGEAKTVIGV